MNNNNIFFTSRWSTPLFVILAYISISTVKYFFPNIEKVYNYITVSQLLLFWALWIFLLIFYLIGCLYSMHREHVKGILGEDYIAPSKLYRYLPKFFRRHFEQAREAARTSYILTFEAYFRSLTLALLVVTIIILIYTISTFC